MYKLIVVFSREAQTHAEEKGFNSMKRSKEFSRGYDYKIVSFETEAEQKAYIRGLDDGNGWSNDVLWKKIMPSYPKWPKGPKRKK